MSHKIKLWIGIGAYLLTNAGAAAAMSEVSNETPTDEATSLTQIFSHQTVNLLAANDEPGKDGKDDKECKKDDKDDKDRKDCKDDKDDEGGEGGEGGEG